ncbi:MAG TPA: hypothetical protein PLD25_28320 [Chloroflexota bacterium]|nr:hypothetical protein [Chloroflexota bacterium]HUM67785.1 hypothetical protein [Chloroflexota bacterium]
MPLDILNQLSNLKPHYRGAIFLTYTLDLVFFEELVAPKLDALGCTNVVILADQHGYDEALARGNRHLRRVGRQYVCAPIINPGIGVQHAKAILLVGPEHGLLLVGSGNLTLHGIGRNLEQFIQFDLDLSNDVTLSDDRYPFAVVWQLIQKIVEHVNVASTITDRLKAISELTPWLDELSMPPSHMRIWHSLDQAIISQWQDSIPVEELRLLSPFWSLAAIETLVNRFRPQQLVLGLNAQESRLSGLILQQHAHSWQCDLQLFAIEGPINEQRRLHAKTFVGKNKDSSWCVIGSANCTSQGLLHSWLNGGNLELVIWQKTEDSASFQSIWSDGVLTISPLDPDNLHSEGDDEPKAKRSPLRLRELQHDNEQLTGHIVWENNGNGREGGWWLELQRLQQRFSIDPDKDGRFSLNFVEQLTGSEAGRVIWYTLEQTEMASPFHWIDQPAELIRFGNRTYHARVKASLQTFAGAGNLFEELMDFLWERVDPRQIQADAEREKGDGRIGRRAGRAHVDDTDLEEAPPPPSSFITDEELTDTLMWHVEGYTPHNQNVHSLRDLLSLALLRLTTETKTPEPEIQEGEERDEDANADKDKQQLQEQKEVLQRLCAYVHHYCQRYAKRLSELEFLSLVGPRLLFENHFTLGRILLEFHEKVQLFSQQDLRRCLLLIYGALFWPEATRVNGRGGWELLLTTGIKSDELQAIWQETNMAIITSLLVIQAWGKPLSWQQTQYDDRLVQRFMLARTLVNKIEVQIGEQFWVSGVTNTYDSNDLFGFRNLSELTGKKKEFAGGTVKIDMKAVANYLTPAEEKYQYLFWWWQLSRRGVAERTNAVKFMQLVNSMDLKKEVDIMKQLGRNGKVRSLLGTREHCPSCSIKLPSQCLLELHRYELKLCPHCRQAALYWKPMLTIEAV